MSMLPIEVPVFDDGRTKQSFLDSTDINKILKKAQRVGSLAHVMKYDEAVYGEFEGIDLLEAHRRVNRAGEIFAELPSEVRNEFDNDAFKFVGFASDPRNRGRLAELIPAIAEPGRYFPNPTARGAQGAGAATAPSEPVSEPADSPASPSSASEPVEPSAPPASSST